MMTMAIFGVRVKVIWLKRAQNTPKSDIGDWGVPKIVPSEYLEEQCHRVPCGMEPAASLATGLLK